MTDDREVMLTGTLEERIESVVEGMRMLLVGLGVEKEEMTPTASED